MDDWVDPNAFRKLWNKLIKSGWKARQPTGLEVDYTYVKPGVVGKLRKNQLNAEYFIGPKELWEYAKREGLVTDVLQYDAAPPSKKPPMGKLAAYAAAKQRANTLQSKPGVVGTANAKATPHEGASVTSTTPVATEQAATATSTTATATEQEATATSTTAAATEQEGVMGGHSSTATSRKQGEFHEEPSRKTQQMIWTASTAMTFWTWKTSLVPLQQMISMSRLSLLPMVLSLRTMRKLESDPVFDDESGVFQQDDAAMRGLGESGWKIYDQDHCADRSLSGADLYTGRWGITKSAAAFADSPLSMLFYFLPKALWKNITAESEAYQKRCIPAIAEKTRERQLAVQARDPKKTVDDLDAIVDKLERQKSIREHEILHVLGLLVARTLCGHTDDLAKHWTVSEDGAVPRGTFGRYTKRERFRTITWFLHFTSTGSEGGTTDKAFKIRPVLQVIEKTFRRGFRLGPRVSFDEGTIPNRSQYNPIRVYNKEKPHKYGTKCYMTCCAVTGYCARVEVYLGAEPDKKKREGASQRAVIRNISKTFEGLPKRRLIVADNFYSSPALALALLPMGFYYVGTQRVDRLGWPKEVMFKQKRRPQYMPRGAYRIAHGKEYPALVATAWMDSAPVHMIATGCSTVLTHVARKDKRTGAITQVPCPQLVADYHSGMGGVDTHDQIRLQRYSIQRYVGFKKYYRQLFLAFVDMAIINGFILHRIVMKQKGERVPSHAEYMRRLQVKLLAVTSVSFRTNRYCEDLVNTPLQSQEHVLRSTKELYEAKSGRRKGDKKRRQFLCKVCSALSPPKVKSFESRFYCHECSITMGGYVPLCNTVRRTEAGNTLTCSQIWHGWRAGGGGGIPSHLRKKIRFRKRKSGEDYNSNTDDGDTDDSS
ncbi:hypothetical protein F441_22605 [Phytophthora nicotianae CJ01A1]|uniref:PiggyBac transposable element-derived protein domain-containing protein n=1 Tax=Phytophthora nicotianae CJ01A1 TaxID=1317063 RepID=W2VRE2_PHYNI|nr:hypothetical protein F441_22605 [Phytophthora nicotianae CJ01A1]